MMHHLPAPCFHIVGQSEVTQRFFIDERSRGGGIRITDAFSKLLESGQSPNLSEETEARWRLVETAWELGVSRSLVSVKHDSVTEALFVIDSAKRRRSITGARTALSGYQKGHSFYCFSGFSLLGSAPSDIDHFFPHSLKAIDSGGHLDGIWNLVLACARCNRGSSGKFDRVPNLRLLERLNTRNEFLIAKSPSFARNPDATDGRYRNALRSRDRPTRRQTRTGARQRRAVRVALGVRASTCVSIQRSPPTTIRPSDPPTARPIAFAGRVYRIRRHPCCCKAARA
jgi:HNH endonuclease